MYGTNATSAAASSADRNEPLQRHTMYPVATDATMPEPIEIRRIASIGGMSR